jgi:hypothetical protein
MNNKAIAYYSLGLTGYEILDIIYGTDDKIKWVYVGTNREQIAHTTKIYYTSAGRAYFRPYGRRNIYLDECIKTGGAQQ